MFIKVIALMMASLFSFGCASTTMIKSVPTGAKLYVDGQYKGKTPYTYTDTAVAGTTKTVLLQKQGYKERTSMIRKEEVAVGPIIGGLFFLFPFLWTLGYPAEYIFDLDK